LGHAKTIRLGNACGALSDEDFDALIAIARLDVGASTWLIGATEKLGGFATRALPKRLKAVIEKAITPILTATNAVVARSHAGNDPTWANWIGSKLSGPTFHKVAAVASGALGGSLGALTAAGDVIVSTTLIMRSIQEIAREYGEDLASPEALADCLSVLAMGGPRSDDDNLDSAFWEMRAGLKLGIREKVVLKAVKTGLQTEAAQKVLSARAMAEITQSAAFQKIIERFGITTQAAFAEKAVPIIGGVAGAFVNYQFLSYYQKMAHVLYRLKAIEPSYEDGQVTSCYLRLISALQKSSKHFDERDHTFP
jgi:hypothetical protein